jgi:hypothetical protein
VARLAVQGLPPRTNVLLDGRSIGAVTADGTFAQAGISAGTHTIRLERTGHQPVTLTRDFAAGGVVRLAAADVAFTALPATVQIQADPDVEMTITRDGRLVQQVKGASQISLDAGTYRIEAMGSARVPLERPIALALTPGESRTLEVRAVTGMDKFPPAGWTVRDGWHTRRGGGIVLYDLRTTDGRAVFSVRLSGTNLFSGGRRLGWIVAYRDDLNYMRCEIDRRNYYRIDIVNGTPTEVVIPHQIPLNGPVVHIGITIAGSRLVQQYRATDGQWQTFDSWTRESSGLTGRFGFFVPGNLELAISNFLFYPPAR